jgi:hypothetical protein
MAKPSVCAALLLEVFDFTSAADVRAADVTSTKAPPATMTSTAEPGPCTDPADFITTNCQLTWHGAPPT